MPCPPGRQSIRPRKIHADQPVRPRTRQGRLLQRIELRIFPKVCIGLPNALLIQCIEQNTLHRLRVPKVVQHLIHEKLPFPVGVTRMDNLIGLRNEPLQDGKLLLAVLRHEKLPPFRHDRKILRPPEPVLLIVFLRLRLPQDMTEEPSHDALLRRKIPVLSLDGPRQAFCQFPAHAWFLRNVQAQYLRPLPTRLPIT